MKEELVGQGIPFDPIESIEEPAKKPSAVPQTPKNDSSDLKPKKKSSPIITILLVVFAVASLSAAVALYIAKEDQTKLRLDAENKIEEIIIEKLAIEGELKDTLMVKRQLQTDVELGQIKLANLLADYQQEKAGHDKIKKTFELKMQEISALKAKLEKEENVSIKMSTKLVKVSREYNDIKTQLQQIRMAKEALENRMLQMSRKQKPASVELETIVVNEDKNAPQAAPVIANTAAAVPPQPAIIPLGPPARLEGQVLVVNREFAFVVINIGEKDGLKNSEVLDVYRGQELLGKVQIERIYDTMSSAVILPKVTKQEIKEGDIVKLM